MAHFDHDAGGCRFHVCGPGCNAFGAAKIDTAYAGIEAMIGVVDADCQSYHSVIVNSFSISKLHITFVGERALKCPVLVLAQEVGAVPVFGCQRIFRPWFISRMNHDRSECLKDSIAGGAAIGIGCPQFVST